ncbi:MAG: hypothetical protein HY735_27305 [Verrucomicrobia bacterium]|nr:hypothetical protein [Verrucomicrobiota bacterium]
MEFVKKHFEKVLLSAVLLGLAVAAALLPLQVSRVRQYLDDTVTVTVQTKPKVFKPLDEYLGTNESLLKRFASPVEFNFSTPHNVFNPVIWRKGQGGRLEKISTGNQVGPGALVVTNVSELRLTVEYDRAESVGGGSDSFRYHFVVIRDTDSNPRRNQSATVGIPNTLFTLTKVDGPPNDPAALHLQLKDDRREIVVSKDKPYTRVVGYAADLMYPPGGNQTFLRRRVKDTLTLKGDTEKYKIVAINSNEVVLSADSTQKRTTVKFAASPK